MEEAIIEPYDARVWRPIYGWLRNVCSPILAQVMVKEFKSAQFVVELLQDNEKPITHKNLYDFMCRVNRKGRRKKTPNSTPEDMAKWGSTADSSSMTQQLNNLKENEDTLTQVQLAWLLEEEVSSMAVNCLKGVDSAFLLNVLTNGIIRFQLSSPVKSSLIAMKAIRNCSYHPGCSIKVQDLTLKLEELYQATHTLYQHLQLPTTDLERVKEAYLSCISQAHGDHPVEVQISTGDLELFEELRSEIYAQYAPPRHYVRPSIRADQQSNDAIENLKDFLLAEHGVSRGREQQPFLLSGSPGSGKTSILQGLLHDIVQETQRSDIPLVVWLDLNMECDKFRFWKQVYNSIVQSAHHTTAKYGRECVVSGLERYSSKFVFIVDLNLQNTRNLKHKMDRGTWIVTFQGVPPTSFQHHILQVMPLSEDQVDMLLLGSLEEGYYRRVTEQYRRCKFKGLINTPDMVSIFKEVCVEEVCIGQCECVPFFKLLQNYVDRKVVGMENSESELIKLGREAFNMIRRSRKCYNLDRTGVEQSILRLFLECNDKGDCCFKYRVIEDYLAAKYITSEAGERDKACEHWLGQVHMFKRVFHIVCELWCESQVVIDTKLGYVRQYLMKVFNITEPGQRRIQQQHTNDEAMDVDEAEEAWFEGTKQDAMDNKSFTFWSFLSKITKLCQRHERMLDLLAELLSYKYTWHFKCKLLTVDIIENLAIVLSRLHLNHALTIKLESGCNAAILNRLWMMLSDHPNVCKHATFQLVIIYSPSCWIIHQTQLATLSQTIAATNTNMFIAKYIGPLICHNIPNYLTCYCMSRLEVLDVCVYDLVSLSEALSCSRLQRTLQEVIVNLNLMVREQGLSTDVRITLPPSSVPLTLTITYFENLQALLNKFESPDHLQTLKIHKIYISSSFTLDLSRFQKLKFLSVHFIPGEKLAPVTFPMQDSESAMEVEEEVLKEGKQSTWLPAQEWLCKFVQNLILPKHLERLLLRNMEFCDDSNVIILNNYWSIFPFQRLLILDTFTSMSKFKDILQNHFAKPSKFDENSIDRMRKSFKRFKLDSSSSASCHSGEVMKQKRLKEDERKERRKIKPEGKELIFTSELKLCQDCHNFSCTCVPQNLRRCRETYQNLVSLVEEIYRFDIVSISYTSRDITVRKDVCGDLRVHCPAPFLDDQVALTYSLESRSELHQQLHQVLQALALAQTICLNCTRLSFKGVFHLLRHLKIRKGLHGEIEPFSVTICSSYYHSYKVSEDRVDKSILEKTIKDDNSLAQFNFWCTCLTKSMCHYLKKSTVGDTFRQPFSNRQVKEDREALAPT